MLLFWPQGGIRGAARAADGFFPGPSDKGVSYGWKMRMCGQEEACEEVQEVSDLSQHVQSAPRLGLIENREGRLTVRRQTAQGCAFRNPHRALMGGSLSARGGARWVGRGEGGSDRQSASSGKQNGSSLRDL